MDLLVLQNFADLEPDPKWYRILELPAAPAVKDEPDRKKEMLRIGGGGEGGVNLMSLVKQDN